MSQQERTRIDPETKLTPLQYQLLGCIAAHTVKNGSLVASKEQIAEHLECNQMTVDRAIRRLREEGCISITSQYAQNGARTANVYTLAAFE